MANGMVMGKVSWFHQVMVISAICLALFLIFRFKIQILFQWTDLLILILGGIVCLTYDWSLNPEPDKLLFGGQLIILWLILRVMLEQEKRLYRVILVMILMTGLVEAVWGFMQLYGYKSSTHHLFRLTGSFYNPGPYSGYLACVLPLSLGLLFTAEQKRRRLNTETRRHRVFQFLEKYLPLCLRVSVFDLLYYFAWICIIAILIVLPAGMSRSAWIAALVGCGWVYWWQRIGWRKTKEGWLKHRKLFLAGSIISILIVLIGFVGIYSLKKDSADGRLLMWKITAQAIMKQPLTGVGLGGFPAAFAETQAEYFASGRGTETEKMVAGCPEYAFNEYLQIGLEQGIPGLIVFVGWLVLSLYMGIRNRHYEATGGIMALAVFAFSSYPLQLPSFWILLVFLSTMAFRHTDDTDYTDDRGLLLNKKKKISGHLYNLCHLRAMFVGIVVFGCSFYLYWQQSGTEEAYRRWNKAKMLYNAKAYESAYPLYEELYPELKHKPEFLFEAGQCLNKMERYEESNVLLKRATLLSSDPMIHYIISKNDQILGDCEKAELRLLHAIDILPERIYPYYLLTKLYADSTCYQADKMRIAADSVLYKTPKVMTTAIREMREEVETGHALSQ